MPPPTIERWLPAIAGHAVLGRYGLGHSLLAWARCYLWCREHGAPMVAPRWRYLRIGPYLRREKDKRHYEKLFHYPGYIRGLRKVALLLIGRKVPIERYASHEELKSRSEIVIFRNDVRDNTRYFRDLRGRHIELKEELLRVTREEHRPLPSDEPFIALHVRRGDFSESTVDLLRGGAGNARLPIAWFAAMLRGLRRYLGSDIRAIVFGDGTQQELELLLREPRVTRASDRSAIHDLLLMSEALVSIGSPSGLAMWGSFLGQVPRVSFPGQRKERLIAAASGIDPEPEWESGDEVSAQFCDFLMARMKRDPIRHSAFA